MQNDETQSSTMLYEHIVGSNSPHIRRDAYLQKTPLAPISEVRRVTFNARYVQDDLDETCYEPVDVVRVKFIPHVSEYNRSEKRAIWYSGEEIKTMKLRAFRDVDIRKSEILENKYRPASKRRGYSCDIRGLERLVYNDVNVCSRIRHEALCAILQEQHQQQCWMYATKNPGGLPMHQGDAYFDDERIRTVAMIKGESALSQEIAHQLASLDQDEANEYLGRKPSETKKDEERDEKEEDKHLASQAARQQQQQAQEEPYPAERILSPMMGGKRSGTKSSNDNCCWCVDVVEKVGRSLLLHAMLTPIFKLQPRGDALLVE